MMNFRCSVLAWMLLILGQGPYKLDRGARWPGGATPGSGMRGGASPGCEGLRGAGEQGRGLNEPLFWQIGEPYHTLLTGWKDRALELDWVAGGLKGVGAAELSCQQACSAQITDAETLLDDLDSRNRELEATVAELRAEVEGLRTQLKQGGTGASQGSSKDLGGTGPDLHGRQDLVHVTVLEPKDAQEFTMQAKEIKVRCAVEASMQIADHELLAFFMMGTSLRRPMEMVDGFWEATMKQVYSMTAGHHEYRIQVIDIDSDAEIFVSQPRTFFICWDCNTTRAVVLQDPLPAAVKTLSDPVTVSFEIIDSSMLQDAFFTVMVAGPYGRSFGHTKESQQLVFELCRGVTSSQKRRSIYVVSPNEAMFKDAGCMGELFQNGATQGSFVIDLTDAGSGWYLLQISLISEDRSYQLGKDQVWFSMSSPDEKQTSNSPSADVFLAPPGCGIPGRRLFHIETRDELPTLLNRLKLTGLGAEIGVEKGEYSRVMLQSWFGKKLYLIDAWELWGESEKNVERIPYFPRTQNVVKNLKGFEGRYEMIKQWSVEAAKQFEDESLDFVYIDAAHKYGSVLEDLESWEPKVKPGGVISGHDYHNGFFAEHLHAFPHSWCSDDDESPFSTCVMGVKDAVDEYIRKKGYPSAMHVYGDGRFTSWYTIKTTCN